MNEKAISFQEALKARDDFESKLITKSWESEDFKREFLANPKEVLAKEFGHKVPANLDVEVVEETGNRICFVLPRKPAAVTAEGVMSDEALQDVAAGLTVLYQAPTVEYDEKGTPTKFIGPRWFIIP